MSEMAATLDKDKVQFVQRSQLSVIWRGLRRSKPGMIGLVLLVVHLFVALASPWIIPYSATAMDGSKVWDLPNSEHLLGNDAYGRDILTRLLLGGRIAILVSFMAAAVSITLYPVAVTAIKPRSGNDSMTLRSKTTLLVTTIWVSWQRASISAGVLPG